VASRRRTTQPSKTSKAASPSSLPRYAKPPVIEVAISVQFDTLALFELVHFGLLWELLRERYPRTEHQPPLNSVVELFGSPASQQASLSFVSGFPVGRAWYLSEDKCHLIQVQPDRFTLNWRKLDTGADYPSYETLKARFTDELDLFLGFVREHTLGELEPRQCELTYINHIYAGKGWRTPHDLPSILNVWANNTSQPGLPELEDAFLRWQYRYEDNGAPLGRLHVQLQSAFRATDRSRLLVLDLTARGAPIGKGINGALAFSDRAHEWIVRGFTAITTAQMHRLWERTQ
jgi:uncharacterized protein (TIGR04255 family)